MEIKLFGTSKEIEAAVKILCQHFEILSESHDEPNRNSDEDRKYLKVKFKAAGIKAEA